MWFALKLSVMESILTFACLWYMWHFNRESGSQQCFMLYYTLQCIGWPNYKLLKPWTSNWKHIKWGWYISNWFQRLLSLGDTWLLYRLNEWSWSWHICVTQWRHCKNWCRWNLMWMHSLGNSLSNAWLLALDTCGTSNLWHNFCHFCRNATVHGISNSLCAVTPLLLVAQGTAHRCEQINSKTRKGVSTFVQKLNQELAVLSIKRTQWAFLIDLPCLNP